MNVICICLDTFRNDIVGPGKKLSDTKTPYLDDFYGRSVAFEGAYGEGQPTLQMRRGFFTGCRSFPFSYNYDRRGHWHQQPGWHKIPPQQDTIAEVLLARGYYTGMVADTYHMFKPTMNYTRGMASYDFVRGQESDNWKPVNRELVEERMKRHVRQPINWGRHAMLTQYLANQGERESEDDYQAARVFRSACEWLDVAHGNAPFFLWIDSFDPHEPWDPPPGYADLYCPDYDGLDYIVPGTHNEGREATDEEIARVRALYLGEVTFVDRQVGRLWDKLEELGLWDDTIVVVLSDHGTQIMDHGGFGKGGGNMRTYNTGFVWYMWHPGGPHGKVVDAYVQSHDLMPTLLAQLGVPHRCEGLDVWPLATGEIDAVRDFVVNGWALNSHGNVAAAASVMDGRWLYSCGVGEAEVGEMLFALPDQDQNVAADHPEVVALQRERIEAVINQPLPGRLNEVCDPGPMPYTAWLDGRRRRDDKS
ncbi:MAG: sulfatase [Armatimonadetes bacterium]|nr:sulfatase [Armatimonadota bacterium]